ncbi:MAG: MmgE/PrpD family protein [Chloroflexota bacterium]
MEVTAKLASFALGTDFKKLPQEVVDRVKDVILDGIGCALGGAVSDRAKISLRMVNTLGGYPQATIIGGGKSSLPLASFANSELTNALDFDIIGPLTGHVLPYIMPTCLALAEYTGASGKDLIAAVAVGLEAGGRVASALGHQRIAKQEWPYFEWTERFSYSPTIFGGVAGGANLLKLDEGQARSALGIAGVSTPVAGGVRFEYTPAYMTKYDCWSGHIASLATTALLFAQSGFTGDPGIFDGEHGFSSMYAAPFFKENAILEGLGSKWHMDMIEFKPYPACRCNHSTIDAIRQLMAEHELQPQEIQAINCKGDPLLLKPLRTGEVVRCQSDTQFCNRYIFALACFSGWYKPGPGWQLPSAYTNSQITELMKSVTVEEHPKCIEMLQERFKVSTYSSFRGALVEITARGQKFSTEVITPKGSAGNPISREELCDKFMTNASYSSLDARRSAEALDTLLKLEKVQNVKELTGLLSC